MQIEEFYRDSDEKVTRSPEAEAKSIRLGKEKTLFYQEKANLKDLDCGDIIIKDSGDLGFDVHSSDGEQVMFLNKVAERALLDWLLEKNKNNPEWVEVNFIRMKEEIGSWRKQ